jgi:hypothetical protein
MNAAYRDSLHLRGKNPNGYARLGTPTQNDHNTVRTVRTYCTSRDPVLPEHDSGINPLLESTIKTKVITLRGQAGLLTSPAVYCTVRQWTTFVF